MTRRVTSQDIARHIGVSRTTVSFVLNGRMDLSIPAKTRERVLRAARELNYSPNASARGLATGRTQIIGVSTKRPTDPHYAGLLDDLNSGAREHGYRLLVVSESDDSAPFLLNEGRFDGLIVVGGGSILDALSEDTLARVPCIVMTGNGDTVPVASRPHRIEWNDSEGARQIVNRLLALKHQKVAMIAGSARADNAPKIQGYLDAMHAAAKTPLLIHCEETDEDDPYRAGGQMLDELRRRYPDVTAVFCRNDLLAIGALSHAARLKLKVPEHLSIAGYSNMPIAAYTVPALTTVRTPIREAGRQAIGMLLQILKGDSVEPRCVRLPVHLIERDSIGPCRNSNQSGTTKKNTEQVQRRGTATRQGPAKRSPK